MSNTKTTKFPLELRTTAHFRARPSETEPGQWTIMRQEAGKTFEGLFARTVDVTTAATLLNGMKSLGFTADEIRPVATLDVSPPRGLEAPEEGWITIDVYADGSAFAVATGTRVPKRDHGKLFLHDSGHSLAEFIAAGVLATPGGAS